MRALPLGWGMIWRMALWGLGGGLLLGCAYGALLPFFLNLAQSSAGFAGAISAGLYVPFFSAPIGAVAGLALGAVDGFLMALFTITFPDVVRRQPKQYRRGIRAICLGVIVVVVVWYVVFPLAASGATFPVNSDTVVYIILPLLIAATASWYASGFVADWVEDKLLSSRL